MTLDGCSNTKMPIINGNQNESDCQVVGMVPNDYGKLIFFYSKNSKCKKKLIF